MNVSFYFNYLIDHAASTQLILYATIMISMWTAEKLILDGSAAGKWRHTSDNALFVLGALPVQIVMIQLCMMLAGWVVTHRWGLVYLLPDTDSPWIKFGVTFVVLDFLDYVYHLAMHKVPAFWRFHLWHHTDQALDVSTTVREHPGETFIRNCFLILWVLLWGASVEVLVLRQTAETASNIFAHTSFRLSPRPARWLGWLFITPNLHHVHHHYQLPATNCNYGDVFSIWDRLLGSWMELTADETMFGLDSHMARADLQLIPVEA